MAKKKAKKTKKAKKKAAPRCFLVGAGNPKPFVMVGAACAHPRDSRDFPVELCIFQLGPGKRKIVLGSFLLPALIAQSLKKQLDEAAAALGKEAKAPGLPEVSEAEAIKQAEAELKKEVKIYENKRQEAARGYG